MKILYSGERFYPPIGGGFQSILTLFEELAKEHEVTAIFTGNENKIEKFHNININRIKLELKNWPSQVNIYFLNKKWEKILDNFVKNEKPDLMVTQVKLIPVSVKIAKKHNIPVFVFVRSYECICLSSFYGVYKKRKHNCLKHASWGYKIQYPFFKSISKQYSWALKNADLVISNSKFMQSVIKEWYGTDSIVIYPCVRFSSYKAENRNPKYITLVTPKERKGIDIFLRIVDKLPNKQFLVVGNTDSLKEIKKRSNIKYVSWTNDMKSIYAQTKILLVPSVWHDPSPRVTLEAMCNGIPCIVSNMGGIYECVGDAGIIIKDIFNIDVWLDSINRLDINRLENDNLYKKLSEKCKRRAEIFGLKVQYKKFKMLINNLR